MRRILSSSLVVLSLAVLSGSALAQVKRNTVDSKTASANAEKLIKEINWIESRPTLTKEAVTSGKLIFYMQMLGNLAGNT
jgi:hypothetical protein